MLAVIAAGAECPPAIAQQPVPWRGELPQAVFDLIEAKITRQTTFLQPTMKGVVRWAPRTIELIDFVRAPSPTYPDTHLFAMRYVVSVFNAEQSLAVDSIVCQVTVVSEQQHYFEPTVACDPVRLGDIRDMK